VSHSVRGEIMGQVRIVTDSAAELPPEVVDDLGITVLPWRLRQRASFAVDGPEFRTADAHREFLRSKELPTPVAPTTQAFAEAYAALAKETDQIVSIHASAGLVDVVQAANRARTAVLGRCQVHVADCQFISRAQGLLVEKAARAAQGGASGDDIVRLVHGLIPSTYLAFHVDSLEHLNRNRLVRDTSRTSTGLPRALFLIEDGQIGSLRRSRRRGTPVERLVEFIAEFASIDLLSILHPGVGTGLRDMEALLAEILPEQGYEDHIFGPVFASCIGPLALGVVVFAP